jgi:hypothetical protein
MQLLYVVSAAILGSDTARRIFHMESIMQDPNVQELIHEWEDKGRAERIDGESDLARLESWLEAAVTTAAIGDVFRGEPPPGLISESGLGCAPAGQLPSNPGPVRTHSYCGTRGLCPRT